MFNKNNTSNNKIHIALALDKNYVVHVYALLASIFYNNTKNKIAFHVIATGVNDLEKEKLKDYVSENNSEIIYYEINEAEAREKFYIHSHYSIATYYRLFFASLINPEIERLLYIDCDTVVIADLKELYNIEMGSAPLAAASDPIRIVRHELGIHRLDDYFNAGVMLIHVPNWRNQQVTKNAIEFLAGNPEKTSMLLEQDALNATLIGKWFRIDNKYNFTWLAEFLPVPTKKLLKDVVIVHYITDKKPWYFLTRNKFRYLYHYYLKMSPKSNEKKYVDFNWSLKNMYVFFRIRMKEFYFDKKINKILPIKRWMKIHPEY